jgi:shikimate kinase/3-dehydroquinate synthase
LSAVERIVLIGFSGTGKSTVATLLADRLGWSVVDTDADIEREQGVTVPQIFATQGEPHFRALERTALLSGLSRKRVVIATGGGAVVDDAIWNVDALEAPGTLVVALDSEPATILRRLREHHAREGAGVERPMIAGDDPLTRITALKAKRQPIYDRADITLVAEASNPLAICDEISGLVGQFDASAPSVVLNATTASSRIFIAPGAVNALGSLATAVWPRAKRAWVISDASVAALHGERVLGILRDAGLTADIRAVKAGESSKSWATAGELLDWLLDSGIERSDLVIALGGGVIGDLAGFVGASVLRGVPTIQVPTTLLAMVDSSIGGKTGLNHRTGKNLIGAFSQPPLVVIDPELLKTLPHRELTAGWAEVIKHGVIQRSTPGGEREDLLTFLRRNASNLRSLKEPALSYAIRRNVALKAAVVENDEKETGIRAFLNFGHTMGHGIEASDYRLLHGEAIAIGMRAADRIARNLGNVDDAFVQQLDELLDAFELPATADVDHDKVLTKMMSDKKRVAGGLRWVLPLATGGVELRSDVPEAEVRRALAEVTSAAE